MASDAFFPFDDGPALAIEAGVKAIIQPGGSKRDDEVIAAADRAGDRDGVHRPPALPPLDPAGAAVIQAAAVRSTGPRRPTPIASAASRA